jgi:hypothetical protein
MYFDYLNISIATNYLKKYILEQKYLYTSPHTLIPNFLKGRLNKLKNKTIFISILTATLIVLTSFSSIVSSHQYESEEKITIETYLYLGVHIKKTIIELTKEEFANLKNNLQKLNNIFDTTNEEDIQKFENTILENGLLDKEDLRILSYMRKVPNYFTNQKHVNSEDDISNSFCYYHASGNGFIYFPIEERVIEWIKNAAEQQENPLAGFVLAILLIAVVYVPVLLFTHLIPFRILLSHAGVEVNDGAMWSIGTQGYKRAEPDQNAVRALVKFFTGITISAPPINQDDSQDNDKVGFLFMSGFAGSVEPLE